MAGLAIRQTTIPAAADGLSGVVDLEGGVVVAIEMPSAWTTAPLTLQAAATPNGPFRDVVDDSGTEITIQAAANRVIPLVYAANAIAPLRFIKLRSGTSATPVQQAATRVLTLYWKA